MNNMLLISKDLDCCLSFSVSVIAQPPGHSPTRSSDQVGGQNPESSLDWAIQTKNWIIRSSRIMTTIETEITMNNMNKGRE
jgi:hypothetical protein